MQLCSSAMVGRLGAAQLGAVGFAGIWMWTLFVPFAGAANGVQSFVSRHDGAGEPRRCGAWVWQAIRCSCPRCWSGPVSSPGSCPRCSRGSGRQPRCTKRRSSYGELRLLSAPFIAANFAMIAFFRGCGDTRTPMRAAVIAISVNIVTAWVLCSGASARLRSARPARPQRWARAASPTARCSWRRSSANRCASATARVYGGPERAAIARFLRTGAPIGGQWLLDMVTVRGLHVDRGAHGRRHRWLQARRCCSCSRCRSCRRWRSPHASGTLVGRYLGAGDPRLRSAATGRRSSLSSVSGDRGTAVRARSRSR